MRVCMLTTSYPRYEGDFAGIFIHNLAKELVKNDVEVNIVAPHYIDTKDYEIIDGIHIHRFQYLYPSNLQTLAYFPGIPENIKTIKGKIQLPFFILSMIKKMIEVVKKYDIDVINAHWAIPPGFIATFTKKIHKKPVIIKLYGAELFPFIGKNDVIAKMSKWLIKYALNSAEKVVGNSDATCNAGKEISGREDIEILPDGVDTETFNPNVNGDGIIKRHNLEGYFMIFSSGRMVERKGFIYLIEAMSYVLKKTPKTKLIIGGDGPEREKLENEVKKLKIENNVIFPGFISDEDFPKYMKSADVFVLPSIVDSKGDTEGLGLVLAEAMACGTPVIGSNIGGITEIIDNMKNGLLTQSENSKDIADKIIKLLSNKNLRQKFSENGLKTVQERFSWDIVTKKFCEVYEEVLV